MFLLKVLFMMNFYRAESHDKNRWYFFFHSRSHVTRDVSLLSKNSKFGRILRYVKMTSIVQQNCKIIELLKETTWGRGWVVLVVTTKWQHISLVSRVSSVGEPLAKNIVRTARRQLDGRHLLFGEYFHTWTTLYVLNLPINMHCRRWT